MTIELRSITTKPNGPVKPKTPSDSAKSGVSRSTNTGADSVKLTRSAFNIQRAEQALSAIPIVNAETVEAIADALNRGDYQIDAEQVALKIIELERQIAE